VTAEFPERLAYCLI